MADIGATLREARMRARIDISEIEAATKIRAKYLRALENEEWDLLPGPTYVKSFLRTYAEALGLDARMLVEDYKLRHESVAEQGLPPRPAPTRRRERPGPSRGGGGPPSIPLGALIAVLVVLILGGLALLGSLPKDDDSGAADTTTQTTAKTGTTRRAATPARRRKKKKRKPVSKLVRLSLTATGPVNVCLRAAGQRVLIKDETLSTGARRGPFKSRDFRIGLGNNLARLRIDGKVVRLRASANPIGFHITKRGRTTLPDGKRPVCTP